MQYLFSPLKEWLHKRASVLCYTYIACIACLIKQRLTAVGTRCADHVTPLYPQKLALTSPTGGGRSVGIVRSRTKATEFCYFVSMYSCVLVKLLLHKGEGNRSQWSRRLRRGSTAGRKLRLRVRIPPWAWMSVSFGCCVVRYGPLRRSDPSYGGVLPRVRARARACVSLRVIKSNSNFYTYNEAVDRGQDSSCAY